MKGWPIFGWLHHVACPVARLHGMPGAQFIPPRCRCADITAPRPTAARLYRSLFELESEREGRRASGQCECPCCDLPYWRHPFATESDRLGYDGEPFLNRLCNGDLVKL